jgi:putative Holliday junction resolvase
VDHVQPWATLQREGVAKDLARLGARLRELGGPVAGLVVGLPLELEGGEGRSARLARQIAEGLSAAGFAVHLQDERYSTVEASRRLRERGLDSRAQRGVIDQAAAAVILEDWLAARARGEGGPA